MTITTIGYYGRSWTLPGTSLVLPGACCHPGAPGAVPSGIVTTLYSHGGHPPTYIPVEVCSAVDLEVSTPLDTCMDQVKADVAKDSVAAPAAEAAGLQKVVAGARERGVDFKVVVMAKSPPIDTPLRDIATVIGQQHPGATVLVLSPGWAGSYSTTYDRVLLEAGQDVAKLTPDPVQGAQNFVDQLKTPIFPWTAFTIIVVLAVAGAAVALRVLRNWSARS
ncbi:MAG: DUF6676 family protein [Mycobacteriaceae bacterium]